MAARTLKAEAVARPDFAAHLDEGGEDGAGADDASPSDSLADSASDSPADFPFDLLFDLPSHAPARDALAFGLAMTDRGYNVFVLGEDGSGRMEATLAWLARHMEDRPAGDDWLYLDDFRHPHRPRPLALPPGRGRAFRDRLRELLPLLAAALARAFASDACGERVRTARVDARAALGRARDALRQRVEGHGLELWQGPRGLSLVVKGSDGKPMSQDELAALPPPRRRAVEEAVAKLEPALAEMRATARHAERDLARRIRAIRRQLAEEALSDLLGELREEFAAHDGLVRWLAALQADILEKLPPPAPGDGRTGAEAGAADGGLEALMRRYDAHLLVDNGTCRHAPVVLEADPGIDSLYGSVHGEGGRTAFHAGALHRAQGGVLVLDASELWRRQAVWRRLKAALRDGAIRIRAPAPLAPEPVPLDAKLVLVGTPACYRLMLAGDPDLRLHVKVKAEIAPWLAADDGCAALLARLIRRRASALGLACRADSVALLMGQACRWAGRRDRLCSRFEHIADLLAEAGMLAGGGPLGADELARAIAERRRRDGGGEERALRAVLDGEVAIASDGRQVGRANGLAHVQTGDHAFGLAVAIAARCHGGAVAIEHHSALGTPLQRAGAVKGWLQGLLARRLPLAFSQPAAPVPPGGAVVDEGTRLAEACAILSALAGVPLRQDIAVAAALDRAGLARAVDGVHHGIEGFFRLCQARGLSGSQGVIVAAASEHRLVLRPEVTDAMAAGRFHLWAVATAAEALELLAGLPAGTADAADAEGVFPPESVFARARAGLEAPGPPPRR